MNWAAELCELYDKNMSLAGKAVEGAPVLLPLYHSSVAAQITVTIDEEGRFLDAALVGEEEKATIIPVTEKSASRTNSPAPHPLCDTLEYLAGDYGDFVKGGKKDKEDKHSLYMTLLQNWRNSPCSHPKVEAVYQYLRKGTLMKDLYQKNLFALEKDGSISEKAKIQVVAQIKAFVRFRILTGRLLGAESLQEEGGEFFEECWKDRTLQQSYIDFCRMEERKIDLSYLSGRKMPITYYHPKKIRNEGDGAKLFSSNDSENFTYLGRFVAKEEAFAIGYEDSQKLHNALKWLIRKQGKNYGDLCIVTWDSVLEKALDWTEDTNVISEQALEGVETEMKSEDGGIESKDNKPELEDSWLNLEDDWLEPEEETAPDTGVVNAGRFHRAIAGYSSKLNLSNHTMILALDAATTGRLAMVECKNYPSSQYVKSIQNWHDRCEWEHWKSDKEKGRYCFRGMVSLRDMAELLYGTEGKGYFSLQGKEGLYKDVTKRILPCILEGREVPTDMVRLSIRRASNPLAYESRFLWERILTLACSLVKQEKKNKEDWTMALDVNCTKRDYLYGRLLALADRVEYRTYEKEEDGKRQTNAKRYMNAFSQHPYRTWKILEGKLEPYWTQLKAGERIRYQNLMDEIYDLFRMEDFENDAALDGVYLLGYHNQSYALKAKKENLQEETK